MKKTKGTNASIFELNGIPQLSKALPLALQHVVAMIVGCVTPAIIVAGVAELEGTNRVMLIQSALVVSALSTFLQLFPIGSKKGFRLGAGHHGNQFCLCGKYAGYCGRCRHCSDIRSTDHRRYHRDDHRIFY